MHRIRFEIDIGRAATFGQVARVTNDFGAVVELATEWRDRSLEAAVRREIDNWQSDDYREATYRRELSQPERDALEQCFELLALWEDIPAPNRYLFDEIQHRLRRSGSRTAAAWWASVIGGQPPRLSTLDPALFERLVLQETAERSAGPTFVESLRYKNPWEAVLIAGAGILGGGALTSLTILARDWGPSRRKAAAEASIAEYGVNRAEAEARKVAGEARLANAQASIEERKLMIIDQALTRLSNEPDALQLSPLELGNLLDEDSAKVASIARIKALQPSTRVLPAGDDS